MNDETEQRFRQALGSNDVAIAGALLSVHAELRHWVVTDVLLQEVAHRGRVPMMELLVRHGADVNGLRWGWFPALFTPCENLEPEPLQWLLDHGADPNRGILKEPGTALDYTIQTYPRDPRRLAACIELLRAAGATRAMTYRALWQSFATAPTNWLLCWTQSLHSFTAGFPNSTAVNRAAGD